jgi:ABC-type transport system substrate-binding protein
MRHELSKIILLFLVCLSILFSHALYGQRARASGRIKIGVLEEPKTLNIWLASDTWSKKVLSLIYQPLYIREPKTLKLIPWLAEKEPVHEAGSLSYTIALRKALWSDGSPFTSADVVFTGNLIKEFKVSRLHSNWRFIEKIEALDAHTVRFTLKEPRAIFLTRTLTTPIVQKKEWYKRAGEARQAERPLHRLLNSEVTHPVGTGPFLLKEWRKGIYLFLERNRKFFGRDLEFGG